MAMTDNSKAHILVVDDDSCILDSVTLFLKKAGYECTCFEQADDCLEYLRQLQLIIKEDRTNIRSNELADSLGTNPPQVRRDLSFFGGFGRPGAGHLPWAAA